MLKFRRLSKSYKLSQYHTYPVPNPLAWANFVESWSIFEWAQLEHVRGAVAWAIISCHGSLARTPDISKCMTEQFTSRLPNELPFYSNRTCEMFRADGVAKETLRPLKYPHSPTHGGMPFVCWLRLVDVWEDAGSAAPIPIRLLAYSLATALFDHPSILRTHTDSLNALLLGVQGLNAWSLIPGRKIMTCPVDGMKRSGNVPLEDGLSDIDHPPKDQVIQICAARQPYINIREVWLHADIWSRSQQRVFGSFPLLVAIPGTTREVQFTYSAIWISK